MARPIGKTLATVVEETALIAPSRPAVFYGDEVVSYGELNDRATEAAKALLALGVGAGDRVGVLLGNNPDWVVMVVASSMIGACFVPLNTWFKKNELAWTMRHAALSVVVSTCALRSCGSGRCACRRWRSLTSRRPAPRA